MGIKKFVYGQSYKPNTFIGGIGGTINTPTLLATTLGINENKIQSFKVVGNNVECAIVGGNYSIKIQAFGNDTIGLANQNITYFRDEENKIIGIGTKAFKNCQYLLNIKSTNYVSSATEVFKGCVRLNSAQFKWDGLTVGGIEDLMNCALTELILPNATSIGGFSSMRGNKFTTISAPNLQSIQTLSLSFNTVINYISLPNWVGGGQSAFQNNINLSEVNCPSLLNVPISTFQNCNNLATITSSQFLIIENNAFINTKILNFIANNVISIGSQCFQFSTMNLIELKKCKSISESNDLAFNLSNSGFTIKTNIFLKTSSVGGTTNSNLVYAKANKGAIVEFYNDAGSYVSTL